MFKSSLKRKRIGLTEDVKMLLFNCVQQRGTIVEDELEIFLPSGQQIVNLAV